LCVGAKEQGGAQDQCVDGVWCERVTERVVCDVVDREIEEEDERWCGYEEIGDLLGCPVPKEADVPVD